MRKTIQDTFTASEASELTEMNIETLRVWRRRGYFKLDGEQGGWTRFTFGDVLKIATFRVLLDNFVTHEAAEIVTGNCTQHYAAIFGGTEDTLPPYVIFSRGADGDVILEVVQGVEQMMSRVGSILAARGESHPTLHVVDYSSILSRVMQRLKAMNNHSASEA